jgi:hypothetical protein
MVLRRRRWQFVRDWSGVPLWPVPMTVLAAVWLAAAIGSVGEREAGMPLTPRPAAGGSAERASHTDTPHPPTTRPAAGAGAGASASAALDGFMRS